MTALLKKLYDTLIRRHPRTPEYYLMRHRRRCGWPSIGPPTDPARRCYQHAVWRARPLCVYCGLALTRGTVTRDHVVPRCRGGGAGDNLVPACRPCNQAKGAHSLLHFLARRGVKSGSDYPSSISTR